MALGNLAVRLANLAEAEGRLAKRAIFKLATALAVLAIVLFVALFGLILLFAAGYFALRRVMPVDAALFTLGFSILLLAGLAFGWAKALSGDGGD